MFASVLVTPFSIVPSAGPWLVPSGVLHGDRDPPRAALASPGPGRVTQQCSSVPGLWKAPGPGPAAGISWLVQGWAWVLVRGAQDGGWETAPPRQRCKEPGRGRSELGKHLVALRLLLRQFGFEVLFLFACGESQSHPNRAQERAGQGVGVWVRAEASTGRTMVRGQSCWEDAFR